MALLIRSSFEPGANDPRLWVDSTSVSSVTGWSAPTTTTSGLAPSDARRWIKSAASTASLNICKGEAITPSTYTWYGQRDMCIEGTTPLGALAYLTFVDDAAGSVPQIRVIRGSATDKYKLELYNPTPGTLLGTSSSEFTTATKYSIRFQADGTNWKLWVNNTEEISVAKTGRLSSRNIQLMPASGGVEFYWATGAIGDSASESDRPKHTTMQTWDIEVDIAGSESEAGWGDDSSCIPTATTAAIADVAMDASDQVDTTTYWCEHASETGAETVDTVTEAFPSGFTIGGGTWRGVVAANVTGKTVTAAARIYDGTSGTNVTLNNIGSTTFFSRQAYFENAPDGTPWAQADVDALKIGMQNQGAGANGANTECACIIFTLAAIEADPPAAAAGRRRLAQVI